jgi:hypothetical protein
MNKKENTKVPLVKRSLTVEENNSILKMKQRQLEPQDPIVKPYKRNGKEILGLSLDESLNRHDAIEQLDSRIMTATGFSNSMAGLNLLQSSGQAIVPTNTEASNMAQKFDLTAQTMRALSPEDEFEGQLIAQLVVLQEHAMHWLGKAMRTDRVDFTNTYLNGATKLLARHHEALETLMKYRRRGEQRVYVEHVHINQGGQAIIGAISTGGGMNQKNEEGPHAKV